MAVPPLAGALQLRFTFASPAAATTDGAAGGCAAAVALPPPKVPARAVVSLSVKARNPPAGIAPSVAVPTGVHAPAPGLRRTVIVEPVSCRPMESPAANGALKVRSEVDPPPSSFSRRSHAPLDGVTRTK